MAAWLVFITGSSGPGWSPGWGHCVVFLGKTLYSHSASLQPVSMHPCSFSSSVILTTVLMNEYNFPLFSLLCFTSLGLPIPNFYLYK